MSFNILVVCIGNVCRSPVAERLLRSRLDGLLGERRDAVTVESAGVRALVGNPVDALSSQELARLGGSAEGFAARQLTQAHMLQADLVLTATKELRSRVLRDAPVALRRAFTLTEFAALMAGVTAQSPKALVADAAQRRASAAVAEYDVPDPIGASGEVHRQVADFLDRATATIASAIAEAVESDLSHA